MSEGCENPPLDFLTQRPSPCCFSLISTNHSGLYTFSMKQLFLSLNWDPPVKPTSYLWPCLPSKTYLLVP